MVRAYLSIGSNLGDRLAHLAGAVDALSHCAGIDVVAVSPVYETTPLGSDGAFLPDQPPYLNAAVSVDSTLSAAEFREATAAIERAMGRGAHGKWESRMIDIDLVLYGREQIRTASLVVPHPRMFEREFVLRPIGDLDPNLEAPGFGRVRDLLERVSGQGCVLHTTAAEFRAAIDRVS